MSEIIDGNDPDLVLRFTYDRIGRALEDKNYKVAYVETKYLMTILYYLCVKDEINNMCFPIIVVPSSDIDKP